MVHNWEERENIFHEALALQGEERDSYLLRACSENKKQLSEIESLLRAFENDADFLEEPVFDMALGLFGEKNRRIPAGTWIGPYQVGKKVGEGGMGEVYDALHAKLNRRVALKFISESFDNISARRQLRREAQAVALLEHDNICAIYDFEEVEGYHFIVMQYIEGLTLAELIEKFPIDQKQVLSIARQIISAVDFAHSHGIIHRDLKPANIMIKPDEQIKVLDFGLAKTILPITNSSPGKENTSVISRDGLIMGTISYMSPEQLRGEKVGFQSDIFSIGIILYELAAGKNPFKRSSQAETIAAILSEEPEPLENHAPKVSGNLSVVVRKCLQKDKTRRFQTATEILTELEGAESKKSTGVILKKVLATSLILLFVLSALLFPAKGRKLSFAVLPIINESARPDYQYLAEGFTREMIENLSRASNLDIKREAQVSRYKEQSVTPQTAGLELNVDAVLSGSIVQRGDSPFLVVQIVKTSDGALLDTAEFTLKEFDLVSIRENLSQRIAEKFQFELTEEERARLDQTGTKKSEALRVYFLGRFYWNRRGPNDLKEAIKYFSEATNLEPSYAKAWAGLADSYALYSVPGQSGSISSEEAANMARKAAKTALQFDPTLSEPHSSLALIKQRFDWDWPGAEESFRTAISLDPEYAPAHLGLSKLLPITGRFNEALAEAEKTKELDPFSISSHLNLGLIYYGSRDYDKAEQIYSDVLNRYPDKTRALFLLGYLYMKTGKLKEATENFEKVFDKKPLLAAAGLGYCYGKTGQTNKALEVLKKLDQLAKEEYVSSQEKAIIYLGMGDTDKAFQYLEQACAEKFPPFPPLLADPLLDDIRSDRRFPALKQCARL